MYFHNFSPYVAANLKKGQIVEEDETSFKKCFNFIIE